MYKLKGVVQHYSWGGHQFIPELIGSDNIEGQPFAEYWLGAHPASPAQLQNGRQQSLYDVIQASPGRFLGDRVEQEFGTLPYLFKILDVRQMLSIQVHPSIESAVKGYADEEERGIPLKAANRNYKDQNHKPELMAALSDFWLLHGFKTEAEIRKVLSSVPELSFLQDVFAGGSYKGLYETVMTLPQEKVNVVLAPLVERIMPLYKENKLDKSSEDFWAARAVATFCKNGQYDRGIFSIYLFNLLQLKKGEGIYQPAGLPHAYLEGQNVEVMANSDNVLRAGLTDKHIDVPELMKHVHFEPTDPQVIPAGKEVIRVYHTPAAEFELTKYSLTQEASLQTESATIFFVYEGEAELVGEDTGLHLYRGEAGLVLAGQPFSLKPGKKGTTVFSVTTPVGKK